MQHLQEDEKLVKETRSNLQPLPNGKPLWPQLFASVCAGSFYLSLGLTIGYSAVLVPQLLDEQNCTECKNVVHVTKEDTAWLVSVIKLVAPIAAPIGGLMMDVFGRLNLIKIATIPTIIGWIIMGAATSRNMLLLGRLLTGLSAVWGIASATYVSEISSPAMRGCLVSITHVYASLGTLIILVEGSLMNWRLIAWSCCGAVVLPALLVMFIPESPSWLVFKNRIITAHASLQWFNQSACDEEKKCHVDTINEELQQLIDKNASKFIQLSESRRTKIHRYLTMFVQPTFYKPLLIILGLYFLQQATGTYVINMYAVTFFKNVGTTTDPYLASVGLGVVRLAMSIANIWLTKIYNRRTLLFISTIGMSISMGISAFYTSWMLEGTATHQWIQLLALMMYVLTSKIGLLTMPSIISGEVFPLQIRGVAQNILFIAISFLMFGAMQGYYTLNDFLGPSGLQYLFAGMSLVALLFCYIFVPETHNKTLAEIEEHFLKQSSNSSENKLLIPNHANYGSDSQTAPKLQIGI